MSDKEKICMSSVRSKQNQLLERAKQLLEENESKREKTLKSREVDRFVSGEVRLLFNNNFVDAIVDIIRTQRVSLQRVTNTLLLCLASEEKEIRHRSLTLLCLYWESNKTVLEKNDLIAIIERLTAWYESEDDYFPGLGKLNKIVGVFLERLLDEKEYETVENLLSVFSRIQRGILFKNSNIRNEIKIAVIDLVDKEILECLVLEYKENEDERRSIASIFVYLGIKSAAFLLRKMISSENNEERIILSDLLACYGGTVVPLLNDCLKKNPPSSVIRNIFHIFGEMEDSSLYSEIKHYASYKDVRVQQQLFQLVLRMGGARLVDRLFEMLVHVEPGLQVKIISRLNEEDAVEVTERLGNFLESSLHVLLRREEVLIALVVTLQQFPSERVLFLLRTLQEECRLRPRLSRLAGVLGDALSVTEPALRHQKRKKVDEDDVSFAHDPVEHRRALNLVRQIRQNAELEAGSEDLEKISEILFAEGKELIAGKDYLAATMILEQIMTLTPESLEKVVKLEDLIERSQDRRWTQFNLLTSTLNSFFSDSELKLLVSAMSIEEYRVGEYVVKAGETDFCLYFVLSGFLQMQWEQGGRNVFLKKIMRGESFGTDQFFRASLWTVNVLSVSPATLAVLPYEGFKRLLSRHPKLEDKMAEFCDAGYRTSDLIQMSGEDRRRFPRYPTHSMVQIRVLDLYSRNISRALKGVLINISEGGLALLVRFASDNIVQNFLGRQVVSEVFAEGNVAISCQGRVVSVRVVDEEEQRYSLHINLSENLAREELKLVMP